MTPRVHSDVRRRGTVLILVAGLSAMLASLAMTFFYRVKLEAEKTVIVSQEAQCRLMLTSALLYVQETSRLGWQTEGHGWTDVRDGGMGPRGPVRSDGSLPPPTWWLPAYGSWPPAADFPASGVDRSRLRWPAPGSVMRGHCYVPQRPPAAIDLTAIYHPVLPTAAAMTWPVGGADSIRNPAVAAIATATRNPVGALQPQPMRGDRTSFLAGDPRPMTGTAGLAWFRIYRETAAERDNDGDPWYDRVAFPADHHATFIITCGAGATAGFRFWSLPAGDPRRAEEPLTAEESGLFADESAFEEMRRYERYLWFRCEWSGWIGGNFDIKAAHLDLRGQTTVRSNQRISGFGGLVGNRPNNQMGTIPWIQRLQREPPRW